MSKAMEIKQKKFSKNKKTIPTTIKKKTSFKIPVLPTSWKFMEKINIYSML